ncbi:TauD/TfdA-like taurine catabolism dioxygenase [Aureococcus anophagefferens]|nr:TauD/TfdA-like taurine catabolism dioxygenase [Aureococcus anophagefferens]
MLRLATIACAATAASGLVAPRLPAARHTTTARFAAATAEKADVQLVDCPYTQWGEPFDVRAAQAAKRGAQPEPFIHELAPPAGASKADELAWLTEHADDVNAKLSSHGTVYLKGWELVKDAEGFRSAYEALNLSPCRDPLDAVSARPMVDKGSAVCEAVNKESRANFFIGMHNEFVGTRAPRAAMFVCFKQADEGGEFMVADAARSSGFRYGFARAALRQADPLQRHGAALLLLPRQPARRAPAPGGVRRQGPRVAAINAKVDFGVKMQWIGGDGGYDDARTLQARAPVQPPAVLHPKTGEPTWFCNVHSHSEAPEVARRSGEELFTDGASQINKSDMYYGDDSDLDEADLAHMDEVTKKHTTYLKMAPGSLVWTTPDHARPQRGKGTRKHAVSWFE